MSSVIDHWTNRLSLLSRVYKTMQTCWIDFLMLCNISGRGRNSFFQSLQIKLPCGFHLQLSAKFVLQWWYKNNTIFRFLLEWRFGQLRQVILLLELQSISKNWYALTLLTKSFWKLNRMIYMNMYSIEEIPKNISCSLISMF